MFFCYDLDLKRPAAPIIQMMHGANLHACFRFPEYLWLFEWTPGMKRARIKDSELDELVRVTLEHNSGA